MEDYHSALERFREKNKECIEKQLEYGEYASFFACMIIREKRERVRTVPHNYDMCWSTNTQSVPLAW